MPFARLLDTKRRLPKDAVFSGRTAAWLHGIDLDPCDPIEVTLPRLSHTSHLAGISLTRSDMCESDVSSVYDLPVTSRVRTVADLARRLSLIESVVVIDMALHRHLTSVDDLRHWAGAHRHYRGVGHLLGAMGFADSATESPMETRLRLLLVSNGLPKPLVQPALRDEAGMFLARVDLYYPSNRLVLEYDGTTHRNRLADDNRRQNRLVEAGYRLLRFTAADILRTPAAVVALVERAL